MKSTIRHALCLGALLSLSLITARSQVKSPGESVLPDSLLAGREAAYQNGLGIFTSGNIAQGEKALLTNNVNAVGTAQWEVESGFLLVRAAFDLRQNGGSAQVNGVAQRALAHLKLASGKFGPNGSSMAIGNMYLMEGQIYERFLSDRSSAERSYQAAVNVAPQLAPALENLNRMQREDAELKMKLAK